MENKRSLIIWLLRRVFVWIRQSPGTDRLAAPRSLSGITARLLVGETTGDSACAGAHTIAGGRLACVQGSQHFFDWNRAALLFWQLTGLIPHNSVHTNVQLRNNNLKHRWIIHLCFFFSSTPATVSVSQNNLFRFSNYILMLLKQWVPSGRMQVNSESQRETEAVSKAANSHWDAERRDFPPRHQKQI